MTDDPTPAPERPDPRPLIERLSRAIDKIKPEPGMDGPHGGHRGGPSLTYAVSAMEDAITALAAAPVTDTGLRELADGINAGITLRLIGGNTDQTYTPNEVAVMVHEVVEQQYAALSRQAETTSGDGATGKHTGL